MPARYLALVVALLLVAAPIYAQDEAPPSRRLTSPSCPRGPVFRCRAFRYSRLGDLLLRCIPMRHQLPSRPRWSRLLFGTSALLLAVGAGLVTWSAQAQAATEHRVQGTIVSHVVSGPSCTSPVALCTAGEFRGAIHGDFAFTATSLVPTADTPTTNVALYTGDLVIHGKNGDLLIKDAGAFSLASDGSVASVSTIVGGTEQFLGASGHLRIEGIFQNGCVDCQYEGSLRTP